MEQNLFERFAHFLTHQVYKVIEYVGGLISFILFQIGIPIEKSVESKTLLSLAFEDVTLSILHGIMSIFITVMGFYIIHVLKKILENKESKASKLTDWIVDKFNNKEDE